MDDSSTGNQESYLQNFAKNVKNRVFSPKVQAILNSNMAAVRPRERNVTSVQVDAVILAKDIVNYVADTRSQPPPNEHAKTMRRTVDELRERHEIAFRGMLKKLESEVLQTEQSIEDVIRSTYIFLAREMHSDRRKNWGRIVTLYAFGGLMAKAFAEKGMSHFVDYCGVVIAEYVCSVQANWIHEQGGWEAFDEYFAQGVLEKRIFQGLLLGVGAAVGIMGLMQVTAR